LTAAGLGYANLDVASLRDAKLDGAVLYRASIRGADLKGASIIGADLREAKVWQSVPPNPDPDTFADLSGLKLVALTDADAGELKAAVERIMSRRVKARVTEAIAPLLNVEEGRRWGSTTDYSGWQTLGTSGTQVYPDFYKSRITEYLVRLQCRPRWSNGAVATGIARRAQRPEFQGDLVAVFNGVIDANCPASKTILPKVLKELSTAADIARGG
jgi:hypothetical protein